MQSSSTAVMTPAVLIFADAFAQLGPDPLPNDVLKALSAHMHASSPALSLQLVHALSDIIGTSTVGKPPAPAAVGDSGTARIEEPREGIAQGRQETAGMQV